jgi:long-chain acyl-CoA synthetase
MLFDAIYRNSSLNFIDDNEPESMHSIRNIPLIKFPEYTRSLAFLYLDNSLSSIIILLSFLRSNHAVTLLSPAMALHFKEELEDLYQPAFIFDIARTEIAKYSLIDSALFLINEQVNYPIHEQIKILLSTSGTTGSPKFVKLSEDNLLQNALSIASYLPIKNTDVTPLNLPVYYSYGLSIFTSNAIKGGTIVCSNTDVLNREFWKKMELYGYTSIAGVPFVYEMLDRIGFTKKKYPSLRYFTQAGGKLQESLISKFAGYASDNDVRFYVMYGQTEATARMSYLPPEKINEKSGSIGIPIPGGKFRIEESSNELMYAGPNVYGGYVTEIGDLANYNQQDWLRTGDLARMDEDGYYYITGRLKRFVKLFGTRINLDEVEALISKQYNESIKCLGIDDKLMLLVSTGHEGQLKDISDYLVSELKLHPTVIKIIKVEAIPLTVNGKPDYAAMRKMYGG